MKEITHKSHQDFKRLTAWVGAGLIVLGITILVLFWGLNLPLMFYLVIPPALMILGAMVGVMGGSQKSLKDELYEDWPLWAIFAACGFGLGIAENHSYISGLFVVAFVVWLRHFTGIAMYFAKWVGRYVEPKYLAWHARRQKSV